MWEIEIDVDGVLADMDGSYGPYVKHIIPDFSEEKHILNWGVPEIKDKYPEAYQIIKSLWSNPDFVMSLPRYPRVAEAIIKLDKLIKGKGRIVIHTHVFTKEVHDMRYKWLEILKEETGVDFEIQISLGDKKHKRTNTFILIEDNVNNSKNSSALYKFLIRRGHNRIFNKDALGEANGRYIANDIYEAVEKIEEIFDKIVETYEKIKREKRD
jgi:5'(3')-deoxyribonucleotidase